MTTTARTSFIAADNGYMDFTPRERRNAITAARRYSLQVPGVVVRAINAKTGEQIAAYLVDNGDNGKVTR